MVAVEVMVHGCRTKSTRRIERATGEVDSDELGDEKRETDADRGDERALMLLGRKHEDGEDQFGGEEHLDEKTLHDRGATTKRGLDGERAGKHAGDEGGGRHASKKLDDEQQDTSEPGQGTDQAHAEGDGGVEQATADAEEDPGIDSQGEAETQSDVLKLLRVAADLGHALAGGRGDVVSDLSAAECEEKKQRRPNKLAAHGDEMVPEAVGEALEEGQTECSAIVFELLTFRGIGGPAEGQGNGRTLQGGLGVEYVSHVW